MVKEDVVCMYVYVCVCVCVYTYVYGKEYYSVTKKNKILPFAATWMDLEGIMLSEISQTGKDTYWMISLICGV